MAIVGINSNDAAAYPADSPAKMKEEKQAAGYVFPYLYDETQKVAQAYRAACTPDFFVFDRRAQARLPGSDGRQPAGQRQVQRRC